MEVKITEVQQRILAEVQVAKQSLQNEFAKISQKESELVTMIAESAGVKLTPNTKVEMKEGVLIFEVQVEKVVKKLKKAE